MTTDLSICQKKNCGSKMMGPLLCCDGKRRYICPECNHSRVYREQEETRDD